MYPTKQLRKQKNKVKIHSIKVIKQRTFGSFFIKTRIPCVLLHKQYEASRKIFSKKTERFSKVWLTVKFLKATVQRTKGLRMGKGKSNFAFWTARLKRGQGFIEFEHWEDEKIKLYCLSAIKKLPGNCIFLKSK